MYGCVLADNCSVAGMHFGLLTDAKMDVPYASLAPGLLDKHNGTRTPRQVWKMLSTDSLFYAVILSGHICNTIKDVSFARK